MSIVEAAKKLREKPKYGWNEFFEENWGLIEQVQRVIDRKGGDFYPYPEDVFRTYRVVRPSDVKVIVLGQDPYHSTNDMGEPTAMGLSFSVRDGSRIPPSLRNIFKVVRKNIGENSTCDETGNLTPWAKQGVFLLNSCLTVKPGAAGSHGNIWDGFVKRTIAYINKRAVFVAHDDQEGSESESDEESTAPLTTQDRSPIAMLWGRHAQSYKSECAGHVFMTSHPSPYSAGQGFMDCDHFKRVNEILKRRGDKTINW